MRFEVIEISNGFILEYYTNDGNKKTFFFREFEEFLSLCEPLFTKQEMSRVSDAIPNSAGRR